MAYIVSNDYKNIIYSQEDVNDIKVWFNNTELENAGYYVESVTCTSRVLPNDASKRFSLDNFISKEVTMILHNVDLDDIQDQVQISIGTLVGNSYEYVPLGVFNIQETPENNNNTITLKLRDNRVKFDVGYNAKYLIDAQYEVTSDTNYLENKEYFSYANDEYTLLVAGTDYNVGDAISGTVYQRKGAATYLQILQDICTQVGVVCDVSSFDGDDLTTGLYDSTITATQYVSYIAEQGGYIPIITRDGHLDFVDLNESDTWQIPLSILSDNYQTQEPFIIERVVYESGVVKYETSNDETLSTLYINSANPYITSQDQLDDILDKFEDFSIDSVKLTNAILGNPAIDPWDYIEVYDDSDVNETVIFKTLANNDYTYNGSNRQLFVTEIGLEERTENVSLDYEETFKKTIKAQYDNLNAQLTIQAENTQTIAEDIQTLEGNIERNYYPKSTVEQMIINAESGVTNTFSEAGGNNILRNTNFSAKEVLEQGQYFEYWFGNTERKVNTNAVNGYSVLLKNTDLYQEQNVINGTYTLSFYYKVTNPLATVQVKINNVAYTLDEDSDTLFQTGVDGIDPINVTSNKIKVEFISNIDNACEIYDIMLNIGTIKLAYSQNANETITDTVNISKGITITSSVSEVKFTANNDGIRTKTLQGQEITTFTAAGMTTKQAVIENQAQIVGILRQRVGDQVWDSLI